MGAKEFFSFLKDHDGREIPERLNLILFFNDLSEDQVDELQEKGEFRTVTYGDGNLSIIKIEQFHSDFWYEGYNLMNKNKKVILPNWASQIAIFGNGLFLIRNDDKISLMDQNGHFKVREAKNLYFSDGMSRTILTDQNGKVNIIDNDGNTLSPIWLTDMRMLIYKGSYTKIIVIENKRYINLMTRNGDILHKDWFDGYIDSISSLGEELYFRVKRDDKFNYVNKLDGSLLMPEWFDQIGEYYGEGHYAPFIHIYGIIGDITYRINPVNGKMERTEIPPKIIYVK